MRGKRGFLVLKVGKGVDEIHASPDVMDADVVGGGNLPTYGWFTCLPHAAEVVARQGFHVLSIPYRKVGPLWCVLVNLY